MPPSRGKGARGLRREETDTTNPTDPGAIHIPDCAECDRIVPSPIENGKSSQDRGPVGIHGWAVDARGIKGGKVLTCAGRVSGPERCASGPWG
jgi:hypothetical protein